MKVDRRRCSASRGPCHGEIKVADMRLLVTERRDLMPDRECPHTENYEPLPEDRTVAARDRLRGVHAALPGNHSVTIASRATAFGVHVKQVIIGLYGPSGVGKDTIQQTLGWPKASFAARFKEGMGAFIRDFSGLDIEKREDKEAVRPLLEEGAKTFRRIDPFIAIKKIVFPPGPVACVTDVRAFNEMVKVWGMGGVVYEIVREGIEFKDHWQIEEAAKVEDRSVRTSASRSRSSATRRRPRQPKRSVVTSAVLSAPRLSTTPSSNDPLGPSAGYVKIG
jgi:hypothetical protein